MLLVKLGVVIDTLCSTFLAHEFQHGFVCFEFLFCLDYIDGDDYTYYFTYKFFELRGHRNSTSYSNTPAGPFFLVSMSTSSSFSGV